MAQSVHGYLVVDEYFRPGSVYEFDKRPITHQSSNECINGQTELGTRISQERKRWNIHSIK